MKHDIVGGIQRERDVRLFFGKYLHAIQKQDLYIILGVIDKNETMPEGTLLVASGVHGLQVENWWFNSFVVTSILFSPKFDSIGHYFIFM